MTRAFMSAAVGSSRVASYDATDLGGSSLRCSGRTCRAQIFLIYPASRPFARALAASCGCNSAGCTSPFRYVAVPLCSYRGDLRFASQKGFQPVMKIFKLMACAAIAGLVATAAHAGAMAGMTDPSAGSVAGAEPPSIVHVQYGYDRTDGGHGGHGGPGGPGWRGGLPGGWYGRPGWYGDPQGAPRNWHSGWGGGWYGGWYQPYWGEGWWASPNWAYGSEHYYGHYPAPSTCGSGGCARPAPEYVPLK